LLCNPTQQKSINIAPEASGAKMKTILRVNLNCFCVCFEDKTLLTRSGEQKRNPQVLSQVYIAIKLL